MMTDTLVVMSPPEKDSDEAGGSRRLRNSRRAVRLPHHRAPTDTGPGATPTAPRDDERFSLGL